MIPTIDYTVYETRMVRNNENDPWQKERVFALFSDGSCLCTENGKLRESGFENGIDVLDKMFFAFYSRPIEKKILPLESALDVPSWCFGCTIDGVDEHFYLHIVHKDCVALSRAGSLKYVLLPELAEKKAYIEREGFGRFNLYLEVEE